MYHMPELCFLVTSLAESGGGGCDDTFLSSEGGRGADEFGGGGSDGAGGGGWLGAQFGNGACGGIG